MKLVKIVPGGPAGSRHRGVSVTLPAEEWEMSRSNEVPGDGAVDRGACMGSGNCAFWAPEVFDLDDEGVAVVVGDAAPHEDAVRRAAANCPTSAIRIERILPC